jgi:hypothetical protein
MIGGTYNYANNAKGLILCENSMNFSHHIHSFKNCEIIPSTITQFTSTINSILKLVIDYQKKISIKKLQLLNAIYNEWICTMMPLRNDWRV